MRNRMRSAFEGIRADTALVDNTAAFVRGELERRASAPRPGIRARLAGAVAAVMLVVSAAVFGGLYIVPYAYIGIDVNPSMELELNRFGRVIDACAYNEEGERILREASPLGKDYGEAAELLMSSMEEDGYLTASSLVSVTVQAASGEGERSICSALEQFIESAVLSDIPSARAEVFTVSAEVRSAAQGCHMSPARYLAMRELMEADESATMESYGDSSISQIRERTRECRNEHSAAGLNGGHGKHTTDKAKSTLKNKRY